MSIASLYTLNDAKRITGVNRNLITFLIVDKQIPTQLVGKAKVLDDEGLELLRSAIADYRAKGASAASA